MAPDRQLPVPRLLCSSRGTARVPRHKVLISIGDFPILGAWGRGWPRPGRLRLPRSSAPKRSIGWRVRFGGPALFLLVRFGSKPDRHTRRLVQPPPRESPAPPGV